MTNSNKPRDINEYIHTFPDEVQEILENIRQTIKEAAPDAKERISYGIPTFTLNGNLVHFAGYKKHIGFYIIMNYYFYKSFGNVIIKPETFINYKYSMN